MYLNMIISDSEVKKILNLPQSDLRLGSFNAWGRGRGGGGGVTIKISRQGVVHSAGDPNSLSGKIYGRIFATLFHN